MIVNNRNAKLRFFMFARSYTVMDLRPRKIVDKYAGTRSVFTVN